MGLSRAQGSTRFFVRLEFFFPDLLRSSGVTQRAPEKEKRFQDVPRLCLQPGSLKRYASLLLGLFLRRSGVSGVSS